MGAKICYNCGVKVGKDVIALNQKMLGKETKRVLCIKCLGEYLDCTEEDLQNLIADFKKQGCVLFA